MATAALRVFDRRGFLRRVVGRGGTLELSCERLYIRYHEAASAGRLPDFLSAVRAKIRYADDVVLAEPEWLAREDFRLALEGALEVRLHGSDGRVVGVPTTLALPELRAPREGAHLRGSMKTIVVPSVVIAAVLSVGSSSVAGRQAHSHPPQPPAKPKAAAAADPQKPGSSKEKPNRPKPENQPGAVMDAAKLAASHADHHEMPALEGGGVLPEGWRHRFDLPSMKLEHLRFLKNGSSWHITSGPPGILYDSSITAAGQYVVRGTFSQLAKGEHREGYGPFVGGADLDGETQRYLYFLVRQDGRFLVKQRTGVNTRGVIDWTPHAAIKSFDKDGAMTNELAIAVEKDDIRFLINGTEVARTPRTGVETDGIVGLRVNHQLDVRVDDLRIER